jgi:hypothetical protein
VTNTFDIAVALAVGFVIGMYFRAWVFDMMRNHLSLRKGLASGHESSVFNVVINPPIDMSLSAPHPEPTRGPRKLRSCGKGAWTS